MENYKVRVSKDYLSFCAAHFIVFHGSQCERLHGHNYRVAAELEGPLDQDFLVFDFIELKGILRRITDELDHRVLVPLRSEKVAVEAGEKIVRLAYEDREWTFPTGDCALLPIENTTAELLARHVATRLLEELKKQGRAAPAIVRITLEESPGQSALYELQLGSDPEK